MTSSVSAISKVERIGYELVKTRKRAAKPATMRDYAKIDFEPWKDERRKPGEKFPPTPETLDNCGVSARLAYVTMLRTKDELIGMFDELPIEVIDEMMTGFQVTAEQLKAVVLTIDIAYARLLVAASAAELRRPAKRRKRPAE